MVQARPLCQLALLCCLAAPLAAQSGTAANNTSAVRGSANGNAEPRVVSKLPIRSLLYPGATTKILVRGMLWFGDPRHWDSGYRSDDPKQVSRQVDDMMSRGIDGVIVAWYGPNEKQKNRALELLLHEAERRKGQFVVATSVDVGGLAECLKRGCDETEAVAKLIDTVVERYASSPAYWRVRSRPVVTFFGMETHDIDWRRVRRSLRGNPMLLFRNSGGFNVPESDGAFAWIAPETVSDDDPMALKYLRNFYGVARKNPGKLTIGSAYKGFDDSLASWGKRRRIDQRCGRTWLETFAVANSYYSRSRQLDALIIPTWNDYEEGTAIEPGIATCIRISGRVDGRQLRWNIEGPLETVDHLEVFAVAPGGGRTLLKSLDRDARRMDVPRDAKARGYIIVAVGRPSMQNAASPVIAAPSSRPD